MQVTLKKVRLAFPQLFEAERFKGSEGKPRFSASFIIERGGEAHKALEAAIKEVAAEAWKNKAPMMLDEFKGNSNKFCVSNGDTKGWDGAEGCVVLAAHRNEDQGRPLLLDGRKQPTTAADAVLYSGCYVHAIVDIWAQTKDYPGVRCSLNGVMFAAEGEAFVGGGRATVDDFADLAADDTPWEDAALA